MRNGREKLKYYFFKSAKRLSSLWLCLGHKLYQNHITFKEKNNNNKNIFIIIIILTHHNEII